MAGCTAHAGNYHISKSALKFDVTIVFLDATFFRRDNFGELAINKGYTAHGTVLRSVPIAILCSVHFATLRLLNPVCTKSCK